MGVVIAIYHNPAGKKAFAVIERFYPSSDRHTKFDIPVLSRRHGEKTHVVVHTQVRNNVNGRRSTESLYDFNLATYDEGDTFDQSYAKGFVQIHGLSSKVAAKRDLGL